MKKIIAVFLAAIITLSLAGCKTKAQRELESAQEAARQANEAYERAKRNYNDTMNFLNSL